MRALLLILLVLASGAALAAPQSARYDALGAGSLTTDGSCGDANVACFTVPAGATRAVVTVVDDATGGLIAVPFEVEAFHEGGFVRGVGCGGADVPADGGPTLIVTLSASLVPHVCDYPCPQACTVRAAPTRGTILVAFG